MVFLGSLITSKSVVYPLIGVQGPPCVRPVTLVVRWGAIVLLPPKEALVKKLCEAMLLSRKPRGVSACSVLMMQF